MESCDAADGRCLWISLRNMLMEAKLYPVLGLMSGTSLDGLDILYAEFWQEASGRWRYRMGASETLAYPAGLRASLASAMGMSGLELSLLDVDYGHFAGRCIRDFVRRHSLKPAFAAVHGHTVFHQPERGLSLQIGDGAAMAVESGLPVINKFRNTDVALGGQGAPLVPIGDALLFPEYDFCLNLGGISNISFDAGNGERLAFDISPCNLALNYLAAWQGLAYDKDGALARKGKMILPLLQALDSLDFYRLEPPKSLGFEWFSSEFRPIVDSFRDFSVPDLLHTVTEHIASQIARVCLSWPGKHSMLLTGGGALNLYLKERIAALAGVEVASASRQLIEYKEALIFAFMGVLRMRGERNSLRSVTGARKDACGGCVFLP